MWPLLGDRWPTRRAHPQARGIAVLAHPGRYNFSADWQLDALVEGFAECGGDGIEVVSGSQSPSFTEKALQFARFTDWPSVPAVIFTVKRGLGRFPERRANCLRDCRP